MLRPQVERWTIGTVTQMIIDGPTDDFVAQIADYVKDKSSLWLVGDDDFIQAVRLINPDYADLFATQRGLNFMHVMGERVRNKVIGNTIKGLFGG